MNVPQARKLNYTTMHCLSDIQLAGVDLVCANSTVVRLRFNSEKGCVVQVIRVGVSLSFSVMLPAYRKVY